MPLQKLPSIDGLPCEHSMACQHTKQMHSTGRIAGSRGATPSRLCGTANGEEWKTSFLVLESAQMLGAGRAMHGDAVDAWRGLHSPRAESILHGIARHLLPQTLHRPVGHIAAILSIDIIVSFRLLLASVGTPKKGPHSDSITKCEFSLRWRDIGMPFGTEKSVSGGGIVIHRKLSPS